MAQALDMPGLLTKLKGNEKECVHNQSSNLDIILLTQLGQNKYLSVKSFSLVARAPNSKTETRYKAEVVSVAANVPTGIERWVSFNEAERFEPAMIPVTAGKNRPTNALWWKWKLKVRNTIEEVKCVT